VRRLASYALVVVGVGAVLLGALASYAPAPPPAVSRAEAK
jgi:hypothetical protein